LIGYFDASALVKRYVEEPGSAEVRRLLEKCLVCASRLSEVEITSALVRRTREGSLLPADRDRVLEALSDDMKSFYVVELIPEIARLARGLLVRHALRANDAIQLASSAHVQQGTLQGVLFVAFDDRLNEAARREGLTLPTAS
jgi:predicted nucleic acid-binding protein